ncbi:hypothetical protein JYK14_22695 [Siccirubricoccus sp. KC 17139]|uniref:Thioesterase family protein n=1 Tax=Siccirubricoccus soli TaxID=2899147 RepID=A0ABT1DCK5_9PROT|nr:hypothetical protein [Siccirubricoccus soli]MCO6418945.1 hypothetical protein [Siccirubricoccus soli]MCP2685080.1 hypothetical protein [Siccirubricoccus soli]
MEQASIAARFRGPDGIGNGGYVAGLMAERLGTQPAEVTLRRGWPLDRTLEIRREAGLVRAVDAGGATIAEARPVDLDLAPPPPPSLAEARAATRWFLDGPFTHSIGRCFVCGSAWEEGVGLRVFTGQVPGRPGIAAAAWTPHAAFAGADGQVAPIYLWSALDCAGSFAFTVGEAPQRMLLGRIAARLLAPVAPGEECIVLGWQLEREGRKLSAGTAIFGADGGLRGIAKALWVTPPIVAS